jgi:hypothetical protein
MTGFSYRDAVHTRRFLGVFFFAIATCILLGVGMALLMPGSKLEVIWKLYPARRSIHMPYRMWLGPEFLALSIVMVSASIGCFRRRSGFLDCSEQADKMNTATIDVACLGDTQRRLSAAFRGRKQGARISFASEDLLWKTLTPKRWALLKLMTGHGAIAIWERQSRGRTRGDFDPTTSGSSHLSQGPFLGVSLSNRNQKPHKLWGTSRDFGSVPGSLSVLGCQSVPTAM